MTPSSLIYNISCVFEFIKDVIELAYLLKELIFWALRTSLMLKTISK